MTEALEALAVVEMWRFQRPGLRISARPQDILMQSFYFQTQEDLLRRYSQTELSHS